MEDSKKESLYNWIMLIGFILVLIGCGVGLYEFFSAKIHCDSIDGNYSLNIPPPSFHTCNNKDLIHYKDGWDFSREISINYSSLWDSVE